MFEWSIRFLRRDWDETAEWSLPKQRAAFAKATKREIIGVEYRLAPEHAWPAPLEDALAVTRELRDVILMGDSAAGYLAVKTSEALTKKPCALVLLSAVVTSRCQARHSPRTPSSISERAPCWCVTRLHWAST
ncbi:MAG: alpha/beta hydrolase [Archangium sp.]